MTALLPTILSWQSSPPGDCWGGGGRAKNRVISLILVTAATNLPWLKFLVISQRGVEITDDRNMFTFEKNLD